MLLLKECLKQTIIISKGKYLLQVYFEKRGAIVIDV